MNANTILSATSADDAAERADEIALLRAELETAAEIAEAKFEPLFSWLLELADRGRGAHPPTKETQKMMETSIFDEEAEPTGGPAGADHTHSGRRQAIAETGRSWKAALSVLMGVPANGPSPGGVKFIWGEFRSANIRERTKALALQEQKDIVFIDFGGPVPDGPTEIIVMVRHDRRVTVFERCIPWARTESDRVELVASSHRFLADGNRLKIDYSRADQLRGRRGSKARERWHARALEMANGDLPPSRALDTPRTDPM